MTTLEDVTKKRAEPSAEAAAAAELVRVAKEQGQSLTGPDGLLKQFTRTVLETALNEEMTEHLGRGTRQRLRRNNMQLRMQLLRRLLSGDGQRVLELQRRLTARPRRIAQARVIRRGWAGRIGSYLAQRKPSGAPRCPTPAHDFLMTYSPVIMAILVGIPLLITHIRAFSDHRNRPTARSFRRNQNDAHRDAAADRLREGDRNLLVDKVIPASTHYRRRRSSSRS